MAETLRIGLVGLGGMGTVHLNNYARLEGCAVTAVCDASPAATEKAREAGLPLFSTVDEMLERADIDVVDVCTPTFLHPAAVSAALEAGRHVICEKPLALTRAEAQAMYDLAQAKGVQLLVGHVLQYAPVSKVLRTLVREGTYGKLLDGQFLRLSACPRWVKGGWLFDKDKSGHIPFDLHIHDLDLLISLLGKPDAYSFTCAGRAGLDYREHYRFSYRFGETTVSAEAAWFNADIPFTATWRACFEEAVVVCDEHGVTAYQFDHPPKQFDISEPLLIPTGINLPPTGMFYEELGDFLHIIRTAPHGPIPRREEILTLIGILEEIAKNS